MMIHTSTHRAFTIVEMLIASVLASLLMIGVLFGTTQMANQTQRQARTQSPTYYQQLADIITADLNQTISYKIAEDQIQLKGFFLIDDKTHERKARPAEVIYRITQIDETYWLMRYQRELGKLSLDDTQANLLCKNIIKMEILENTVENEEKSDTDQLKPIAAPNTWQTFPASAQLVLSTIDQPETPLVFLINNQ